MAAVDPSVYAQLCKLFPKLTLLQVTDACLYSAGATYKEIGELRGVSPETIKKSLEAAQRRLGINSLQTLRMVFLCRAIFGFGSLHQCRNEADIAPELFNLSPFNSFIPLVPDLSLRQATCIFYFVSGDTVDFIAELLGETVESINQLLDATLNKLKVSSLNSLRIVILSKLLINLTLVPVLAVKH